MDDTDIFLRFSWLEIKLKRARTFLLRIPVNFTSETFHFTHWSYSLRQGQDWFQSIFRRCIDEYTVLVSCQR